MSSGLQVSCSSGSAHPKAELDVAPLSSPGGNTIITLSTSTRSWQFTCPVPPMDCDETKIMGEVSYAPSPAEHLGVIYPAPLLSLRSERLKATWVNTREEWIERKGWTGRLGMEKESSNWKDGARSGDGTVWARGRLLLCLSSEMCPWVKEQKKGNTSLLPWAMHFQHITPFGRCYLRQEFLSKLGFTRGQL